MNWLSFVISQTLQWGNATPTNHNIVDLTFTLTARYPGVRVAQNLLELPNIDLSNIKPTPLEKAHA